VQRYLGRISGPLLDRIDLHVEVGRPASDVMFGGGEDGVGEESSELEPSRPARSESAVVRRRVGCARERSVERLRPYGIRSNAEIGPQRLHQVCRLDRSSRTLLAQAMTRLGFTARACHRAIRVARTIADLEGSGRITEAHVAEAVMYRVLDRSA
jgi:magnesium chelatase family protein